MARPKDDAYLVSETPATQLTVADLIAALQQFRGDDEATMRKRAEIEAEAIARLQRRENPDPPDRSDFNPEGERDSPRPELKCKMFWLGFPLDLKSLTKREISLLNRVEQTGEFIFKRTDMSPEKMTISGEKDPNGRWEKIEFQFKARGEARNNLPPMAAILSQVLGEEDELSALRKEVETLRALVA